MTRQEAQKEYQEKVKNKNLSQEETDNFYYEYLYRVWIAEGDTYFFTYLQNKVISNYNKAFLRHHIKKETTVEEYAIERVDNCSKFYYETLDSFGLIEHTIKFDKRWLKKHADDSLVTELQDIDIKDLLKCIAKAKPIAKHFFKKFHTDFVPSLTNKETYAEFFDS